MAGGLEPALLVDASSGLLNADATSLNQDRALRFIGCFISLIFLSTMVTAAEILPVGSLVTPASQHRTATLSNGDVLLFGGQAGDGGHAIVQRYSQSSETFEPSGEMLQDRFVHDAALMGDGLVIITGGFNDREGFLISTEIYDPATQQSTAGPDMHEPRDNQRSVVLSDGRVFLTGGDNDRDGYIATTEIASGSPVQIVAGPTYDVGRALESLSLTSDGRAISAGGLIVVGIGQTNPLKSTVLFDPVTNLATAGPDLVLARFQHHASNLADGSILITGGGIGDGDTSSAEIINSDATASTLVEEMNEPRREHCSTTLLDGRVFIAGGASNGEILASTEVYDPVSGTFSVGPSMGTARVFHTCTLLPDGSVLIAGGASGGDVYPTLAERFVP